MTVPPSVALASLTPDRGSDDADALAETGSTGDEQE
jgi:hypothetical protein